jgi:hypothetical protein
MTKNKGLAITILGLILAVFQVLVFLIPFERGSVFWVAYGFTTFAILAQAAVVYIAVGKADTMKSKFMGFPIVHIGFVYLVAQLIIGGASMLLPMIPSWLSIIVQVVVLFVAAVSLIATEAGRDEINRIDKQVEQKVMFIQSLQVDLQMLLQKTDDVLVKKQLSALIDSVKYSDPMTSDALVPLERSLEETLAKLECAIQEKNTQTAGQLAEEFNQLLTQRNKKCKILK